MKKNRMMRLASILLVATLMSTCTISGTFAKYVTYGSASDTARVAKWGVNITASGSLFADTYVEAAGGNTPNGSGSITVKSSGSVGDHVVAPGTKNTEGLTFAITGTPEVSTRVLIAVTGKGAATEATDVVLAATTYDDPTTATDLLDKVTLASDYHPVKFTLTKNGANVTDDKGTDDTSDDIELKDVTLSAVESYLETYSKDKVYAPNTNLGDTFGTYKLTWEWAFGDAATDIKNKNIADTDRYDTILGNAAVASISGANTDLAFNVEILVEQVD